MLRCVMQSAQRERSMTSDDGCTRRVGKEAKSELDSLSKQSDTLIFAPLSLCGCSGVALFSRALCCKTITAGDGRINNPKNCDFDIVLVYSFIICCHFSTSEISELKMSPHLLF